VNICFIPGSSRTNCILMRDVVFLYPKLVPKVSRGQRRVSSEISIRLLREWEAIMRRIESIDARLWQGAGILLAFSIGGISFVGWHLLKAITAPIPGIFASVVAIAILSIWWFIFHRWIYLQSIYSHRAREIERSLDLWFNRYARLVEHWGAKDQESIKSELKQSNPVSYSELEHFWRTYSRRLVVHVTIRRSLGWLTIILLAAWAFLLIFSLLAYFRPETVRLFG